MKKSEKNIDENYCLLVEFIIEDVFVREDTFIGVKKAYNVIRRSRISQIRLDKARIDFERKLKRVDCVQVELALRFIYLLADFVCKQTLGDDKRHVLI